MQQVKGQKLEPRSLPLQSPCSRILPDMPSYKTRANTSRASGFMATAPYPGPPGFSASPPLCHLPAGRPHAWAPSGPLIFITCSVCPPVIRADTGQSAKRVALLKVMPFFFDVTKTAGSTRFWKALHTRQWHLNLTQQEMRNSRAFRSKGGSPGNRPTKEAEC